MASNSDSAVGLHPTHSDTIKTAVHGAVKERALQVVVAFNFTPPAEAALERAIDLARRAAGYVFHFVCIIDPHRGIPGIAAEGKYDSRYADRVQQQLAARIDTEFATRHVSGSVHFFIHARFGVPAPEILFLANGVGADLIIVGSHGLTGVERVLLGSVSETVVRDAGCSVIVARTKSYADVKLLTIIEHEPDHEHPYVPPHRYYYEETRLITRPVDWPLY